MQTAFSYDCTSELVRSHVQALAPNNGEPPSPCLVANINAVNSVSNLNVNASNVVGQPFIYNGGMDVNSLSLEVRRVVCLPDAILRPF